MHAAGRETEAVHWKAQDPTMTAPLKAIFFDVGNTLLFPHWSKMLAALHQCNIDPDPELLQSIERRTKNEFDAMLQSGSAVDHGFWYIFYSHLLQSLTIQDDPLRTQLVSATRVSANWCEIRGRTREILLRLGRQYRLGVISNADGKIANLLERCGIADCFEIIVDSFIVGHEKPHPAIFEAALRQMGTAPRESLYVGDIFSVDYLGATALGMTAILMDVCGAYREKEWPRVESLEELESKIAGFAADVRA
jgi:putative hydrolase of the HAD superfamily